MAGMIDHTLLKADATAGDVKKLCDEARKYCFASVCVNSTNVAARARLPRGLGRDGVRGRRLSARRDDADGQGVRGARGGARAAPTRSTWSSTSARSSARDYALVEDDIRKVVQAARPAHGQGDPRDRRAQSAKRRSSAARCRRSPARISSRPRRDSARAARPPRTSRSCAGSSATRWASRRRAACARTRTPRRCARPAPTASARRRRWRSSAAPTRQASGQGVLEVTASKIDRVIWIVLDSCGCGAAPDAAQLWRRRRRHARQHERARSAGMTLPHLQGLGLGHLTDDPGRAARRCAARRVRQDARGLGRQGHDHRPLGDGGAAGRQGFPTFPNGFPAEMMARFEKQIGRGMLGNKTGVGHRDHRGARRRAHEDRQADRLHVGRLGVPDRRARGGHPARRALSHLRDRAQAVRRAADRARDRAAVRRRAGQVQAHLQPARLLDAAADADRARRHRRRRSCRSSASARSGTSSPAAASPRTSTPRATPTACERTLEALDKVERGLVFTNLVDFDMLYGHRRDPAGYYRALQEFDAFLPRLQREARAARPRRSSPPTTATIRPIAAPTTRASTCRSSPWARSAAGHDLGVRNGFYDIAQTLADGFGLPPRRARPELPRRRVAR